MSAGTVFILLTVFTNISTGLDCNIPTNTDGFKILPDYITCICSGIGSVFQWSSLESIQSDLLPFFNKIIFTNCTTLVLDLLLPPPDPLPLLVLNNMEEVVISVSMDMASLNISLSNVTSVQYIGQDGEDSDQLYLYLSLSLGTLCVVLIIVLTMLGVIARLRARNDPENKKVSRAESWRYESSIYVKPPAGQKPVYVPPPLPPSVIDSGPPTWSRPPNSLSSSPLLRTKYNSSLPGLMGVDIVRTSLPTHQERRRQDTYQGTQVPCREIFGINRNVDGESRESVNNEGDSEDDHKEEEEGNDTSTLPYR
eukprot:GFUD01003310.1.p1 GENE.GFUD01003310.1~~GFUD01003310.1.p1  ORF type:complete len:310 (+),score=91.03 GFUD01003310.1:50-979(+)